VPPKHLFLYHLSINVGLIVLILSVGLLPWSGVIFEKEGTFKKFWRDWGRWIKENGGRGEFKYNMFDIRSFVNATCTLTQHNNKNKYKKKKALES
jgi:hypothetical protein